MTGVKFGNGCAVNTYPNATEALQHIKDGDIVVYSGGSIDEEHVFIVAHVEDGKVLTYDAGAEFHWREGSEAGTTSGYFDEMRDYSCTVISVEDLTWADIQRIDALNDQLAQSKKDTKKLLKQIDEM